MLDPQDEMYDRRLASHLVSLYFRGADEEEEENLVSFYRIINTNSYKIFVMMGLFSNRLICVQ